MTVPARRVYSLDEVAAIVGRSTKTLRSEIAEGRLRAKRLRSRLVVLSAEVDRYLAALPDEPTVTPSVRAVAARPPTGRQRVQRLLEIAPVEVAR